MARRNQERVNSCYVFSVKATGVQGLIYLPLLAFVWAYGLIEDAGAMLLAGALSALSVPICLVLLSDGGWPLFALRPRSIVGRIVGFVLLSVLGLVVVAQAFAVLVILAVSDVLAVTGLDAILALVLRIDPASDLFEAKVFRVLFAPLVASASCAGLLVFVVRFDPSSDTLPPLKRAAGGNGTHAPSAENLRVRPFEQEAALRAMRRRMAKRQAHTQSPI